MSWEELMQIPHMDSDTANEILIQCRRFCQELRRREAKPETKSITPDSLIQNPRYHDALLRFAEANDMPVEGNALSNRSVNQLQRNGYHKLSQCLFLTGEDLSKLRNLGAVSIKEILSWRDRYLEEHEKRGLRLSATTDAAAAYADADYVIIAAPTNYDPQRNFFDTSAVEAVYDTAP